VFAQEADSALVDYKLWLGAHYTGWDGYRARVGLYEFTEERAFPELKFDLTARKKNASLEIATYYYDRKNIFGNLHAQQSDRVTFDVNYVSLIRNFGQDQLANLETREWLGDRPGGKMVTNELLDEGVNYALDRQTVASRLRILLSKKGNVTLNVAHRSIFERGNDQAISISHCFSCHVESQELRVERETHTVRAGLAGRINKVDLEYVFNYRKFFSDVPDPETQYDPAIHPVTGGSGAEFQTRVIYQNAVLPFHSLPETEKYAHYGKIRGKVWKGRLNGSLGYVKTENQRTTVESEALSGDLAYAVPVSPKNRLVLKLYGLRREADDVFIDLPTWREGRPDNNPVNFDWKRYSSLSRTEGRGDLEWITRLAQHTTLGILGGYKQIDRWNYPTPATTYQTKQFALQGRLRYRDPKWRGMVKYRYENTQDPLRSDRGLLEKSGRYTLQRTSPNWAFYYQREDLRFLNVTTLPTDAHEVHLKGSVKTSDNVTVNAAIRTVYDENKDLDTLDVHHYMVQPNVNLVLSSRNGVTLTTGYTYDYSKRRGPFAIPLFDG
jgi:hypothetical protein